MDWTNTPDPEKYILNGSKLLPFAYKLYFRK